MADLLRSVDIEARAYVARVDRALYDGRMTTDEGASIYRQKVAEICTRGMREESAPITSHLLRIASMSIDPPETPPEVTAHIDAIAAKWKGVFSQLCDPA